MDLTEFDFAPRTRVVFGPGTIRRLGELVKSGGGTRALVVTDAGIVGAGHVEKALQSLCDAGIETAVFSDVHENPTTLDVDACVAAAVRQGSDFIVGLGGGSSLDTAKGCNFLLTNGGRMSDYWGVGKALRPMLPMIAVPTTAGTGSECQSFALIADAETHQKMACGDPKAAPQVAVLDPLLTLSQPKSVTACTGIDALTHAVETAVTVRRTPISRIFSREAFVRVMRALPVVLQNPRDVDARGEMLLGAALAGIAIENSMLGAAHSCANPLTAKFGTVHGHAVGLMLPHVVRFNAELASCAEEYRQMAVSADLCEDTSPVDAAVEALASRVGDILALAELPAGLRGVGVTAQDAAELAQTAAQQWTAQFNPRALTVGDFERLYCEAM
jgi:alcohol dehydrogenase